MHRHLAALLILFALAAPAVTRAQSVDPLTTPSASLTQEQRAVVIAQLQELILQLTQQLQAIIAAKAQQGSGSTPGVSAACTISRTLALGMRGDDVKCLQTYLISQNLLTSDSATGYYGRLTKAAVIALQRAHNLEQVGHIGKLTRAIVNANPASAAPITDTAPLTPPAPTPAPVIPSYGGGGGSTPPPSSGGGGGGGDTTPPPPIPPPAPGDTTPPTISLVVPAASSTFSGTVTISATASDNVAVAGVQFKIDGTNFGAEEAIAPYGVSWNTASTTNGTHTITAVVRDTAGNTGTASVTITVANAPAIPAPSVSVLQGVHIVPVIFNDWTLKPAMNAEVTPSFFTAGGGWTMFFIPTERLYTCATPDNIFTLSGFPSISSRQNCHLRMQSYVVDTNYTATDDPYPWRWKYHTAFSAFLLGASSNYTLYTINHGEHGNVPANLYSGQKTCLQAPDIGYGVIDCNSTAQEWASYNAFISMSSMPWTLATLGSDTRFTDLGPIAWPANGYVETINGTTVKATDGGIRHSSSIIKDGYLYVFFDDESQGDPAEGRGPGFKVMRAPIVANNIDPHSFKTYYNGAFTDSALPAGFAAANVKDFYAQKGGRSSAIFPDLPVRLLPWTAGINRTDKRVTTMVPMFDVALVQSTSWYLGVSLELDRGITLRLSKDLVHWSLPTLVPGTEWDYWAAKGDSEHYMLLYPRLANANGKTTSSVDPNDFYVIGMTVKDPDGSGPLPNQKTMQAVELKLMLP